MDETYINVKGAWKYLNQAVDKERKTVDFLLTARHAAAAARRFFDKAMRYDAAAEKVTMDKSGVNRAALDHLNWEREVPIKIGQVQIPEQRRGAGSPRGQAHHAAHARFQIGLGSERYLAGIELMLMIRKNQFRLKGCDGMPFAGQFYALAGRLRPV